MARVACGGRHGVADAAPGRIRAAAAVTAPERVATLSLRLGRHGAPPFARRRPHLLLLPRQPGSSRLVPADLCSSSRALPIFQRLLHSCRRHPPPSRRPRRGPPPRGRPLGQRVGGGGGRVAVPWCDFRGRVRGGGRRALPPPPRCRRRLRRPPPRGLTHGVGVLPRQCAGRRLRDGAAGGGLLWPHPPVRRGRVGRLRPPRRRHRVPIRHEGRL